tara:strand:+ start:6088 stop:6504 length:417 start_codon:yes stop_codon:yes gene_type:complete
MVDIKSKKKRSENMARIKPSNTKPEMAVRKYLSSHNIKYRCNVKSLPGNPDIAIKKYKLAIMVHGCFWHSHKNCKDFRIPKSNVNFWTEKLNTNLTRDYKNETNLKESGYSVFTIWECEIKSNNFRVLDEAIKLIKSR